MVDVKYAQPALHRIAYVPPARPLALAVSPIRNGEAPTGWMSTHEWYCTTTVPRGTGGAGVIQKRQQLLDQWCQENPDFVEVLVTHRADSPDAIDCDPASKDRDFHYAIYSFTAIDSHGELHVFIPTDRMLA